MTLWKIYFGLSVTLQWIPRYIISSLRPTNKPIHLFFCTVDHFEPGTKGVPPEVEVARVSKLLKEYPKLVQNHKDFAGNIPKRTWFFPPHYHRFDNLKRLVELCKLGYGEIELHLHHGKTRPDSPENLERTIRQCIEEYSMFGIFGNDKTRKRYAFIHGDYALDNSLGGRCCGVNNELEILRNTGCYADFTFPCSSKANPRKINSIYYAIENPMKPKSYNTGINVRKLSKKRGDLMIIQGPLFPYFINQKLSGFRAMSDKIDGSPPVDNKRIDRWVKTGIHILGQRNCVFIKTHTHGVPYSKAVLGEEMDNIFGYLEKRYNDGKNFLLHYVTARELYNIVKAIEAGEQTKYPEEHRNYKVQPPIYDNSVNITEASNRLKQLIAKTYS